MRRALLVAGLLAGCHDAEVVDPGPCVPATCETRGYDCGTAWDGCTGTIECGACGPGFVCGGAQPNVCSCDATTCDDLLVNCGSIDDGCGGTVECGACADPAGCGDGGDANVCALAAGLACDEQGFCWENPSPVPFEPFSMHARAADDIWAVGYAGQIRHFDGAAWGTTPSGTDVLLRGVWAAGPDDAWAAGLDGTLLHWDGDDWSPVDLGTTADLTDVNGRNANDVWVVGVNASFRWDGDDWSPATPSTPVLYNLYVAGPGIAFATGGGRVWEWTAAAWVARTPADDDFYLTGIVGRSAAEIYAVGWEDCGSILDPDQCELVYRRDGPTTWTYVDTPEGGPVLDIYSTPDQIVAVRSDRLSVLAGLSLGGQPTQAIATAGGWAGDGHVVLGPLGQPARGDGVTWASDLYGPADDLRAGGRVGDSIWLAGGARVLAWRGSGLVEVISPPGEVLSLQGQATDQVWAVVRSEGDLGGLHLFDGEAWTPVDAAASVAALWSNDIDSYAVGDAIYLRFGEQLIRVHRSDDTTWRAIDGGPDGAAWAVGTRDGAGVVARRSGGAWSEEDHPDATSLCGVLALGPDDVWVAGSQGGAAVVSHWNGDSWATQELGEGTACQVRVADGTLVALAGGALWRRAGPSWQPWLAPPARDFAGLEVDGAGTLWVFGAAGSLVQRPAP